MQAALLSVEKDRIHLSLRLMPGAQVAGQVLPLIDSDKDGAISRAEGRAYAGHLLGDLRLTLDGKTLALRMGMVEMPAPASMKEGLGQIRINLSATALSGAGAHTLALENNHQGRISAYLVNSLAAREPAIKIQAQTRNPNQSRYQLDYTVDR